MPENTIENIPIEGDLVVCTVEKVEQNGAYVKLDTYDGINGFIFVGEVASGWIKNIRAFLREGQRVVCKVLRVKDGKNTTELSLKSVSEERKRDTLQAWKNERRATQLIKVLGEKHNWSEDESERVTEDLRSAFGTLYASLEACAISQEAISDAGFTEDWVPELVQIAIENIVPPFVEIRGQFDIQVSGAGGIQIISDALSAAEEFTDESKELKVECFYDGAPHYRLDITAPDYKMAEDIWNNVEKTVEKIVKSGDGSSSLKRV